MNYLNKHVLWYFGNRYYFLVSITYFECLVGTLVLKRANSLNSSPSFRQMKLILLLKFWSTGHIKQSSMFSVCPPGGSKGISSWAGLRGCHTVSDPDHAACCHVAAYSRFCRRRAHGVLQSLQYASSQDHLCKNSQVHFPLICCTDALTHTHTHVCTHISRETQQHYISMPALIPGEQIFKRNREKEKREMESRCIIKAELAWVVILCSLPPQLTFSPYK